MSRQKRYGHGRWPRKQLYAIVAGYREAGRSPEWVSRKLGVGPALTVEVYDYLEWRDESEYLPVLEEMGHADPLDVLDRYDML